MRILTDKFFLLCYCFGTLLFTKADTSYVSSFLTGVALSATLYFFYKEGRTKQGILASLHHPDYNLVTTLLYGIALFFLPRLCLFTPLIAYDAMAIGNYPALLLYLIGITAFCISDIPILWIFLIFGLFLACYLARQTLSYTELHTLLKKTRDDSTELNLLLSEKNQALLDNQDYEIYTATLRERNRIAREIHDNVGHMLSRSILMVGALKAINREQALDAPLESLDGTLNTAMDNIRTSVHDLHDESVNLREVIEGLTGGFSFCPVTLEYDISFDVPRDVKYCFITIVKEGLSNIAKHSNASHAYLTLREHPGFFQLVLSDNGTVSMNDSDSGLGLINMRDRVSTLKGTLEISREKGFKIFIMIPKT
ncbi:sensor histidine kinase [Hespellia stercorisuis]|uniref:histidine kinase n=1 Tax=Hespellia stercorisuis DSM 15480 TaxID=1121950 RepID=A0A1M6TRR7_9FIRM|nr:histidine kinase [Hespellia stercorisuis]SHK59614.1 Signal transduction histidine kinase [Hespellia stercorisuis DSM 15480]